jgi:DNA-binding MarR family transcriptional regulator/GNAT superfamily N-acetyltransferase
MPTPRATKPTDTDLDRRIAAVRSFNRVYTRQIGLLRDGLLRSTFSLAEARVLYELAHREAATASEIAAALVLDQGYLSRILAKFAERKLIAKTASPTDRRQHRLSLTAEGRAEFGRLDRRSHDEIAAMLAPLAARDQERMVKAMQGIQGLLDGAAAGQTSYLLRPHQPGDMGWIVARHGTIYAEEYGWDQTFEGFVAGIAAEFIANFDPKCERCWIAEIDGEPVGAVCLARHTDRVAKLRLLFVERKARGRGIGRRLVEECVRFARQSGYATVELWTQSILTSARAIYERAGFRLVRRQPHASFGRKLVGETWELKLRQIPDAFAGTSPRMRRMRTVNRN